MASAAFHVHRMLEYWFEETEIDVHISYFSSLSTVEKIQGKIEMSAGVPGPLVIHLPCCAIIYAYLIAKIKRMPKLGYALFLF